MVTGGGAFELGIDSIKHLGLFNEDKVESALLGIIVIFVLSWLTLTAYTLFREPKLLKHWNYSNLGLLGVIALFGITSFLAVSFFILFILMQLLPNLLPALVLSDESVYSSFFTYAFFTQVYMLLILFYGKLPGKIPDSMIVPAAVAKVIKLNFSALWIIPLAGILLFAARQGEWVILLLIVWLIIGCLFLGIYLGISMLSIAPKRLKTNRNFSPMQIQIINRLFFLSIIISRDFLYGIHINIVHLVAVAIALFASLAGPEKIKSYLKSIFVDRILDVILAGFAVLSIIRFFNLQGEIRWFNLITGVILLGGIVLYLLSLKRVRDFLKRRKSKIKKWWQRLKKKVI